MKGWVVLGVRLGTVVQTVSNSDGNGGQLVIKGGYKVIN